MPLDLTHFNPAALAVLNRWALQMENNHNALKQQIKDLQGALHRATTGGNPTLAANTAGVNVNISGGTGSSPSGYTPPLGSTPRLKTIL